jgi:putative nucleotidyltransferase with HDIG domain
MFVCGLLHDIGQLVFYRKIPVLAREVGLLVEATDIDEVQAEINIIGFDHYQTGAELARLWKLPEIIVTTMAEHNNSEYNGIFAEDVANVRAASQLVREPVEDGLLDDISGDDLIQIIDKVRDQFEQVFKVFYPN